MTCQKEQSLLTKALEQDVASIMLLRFKLVFVH